MLSDIPVEPENSPPFTEPWHALVFALTMKMAQSGHFTWPQWAARFAGNLAQASAAGAPKDASHYDDTWLATFEELLSERGLASPQDVLALKTAWTQAYLHTPHGEPVELARPQPE